MRGYRSDFTKRMIASVVLAIFMSQISLPVWEGTLAAWAATRVDSAGLSTLATLKDEVAMGDEDLLDMGQETTRKANVLFMIDASAAMQFHPKGVMPSVVLANKPTWRNSGRPGANWVATYNSYGYTVDNVIDMMRNATYGIGAMPVAWSGANLRVERNLYGRDIDTSNNYVKKSSDPAEDLRLNAEEGRNYYAPFIRDDDEAINLVKSGYASQTNPLQVGHDNVQKASHVGDTHYSLEKGEIGDSVNNYIYSGNSNISGAQKFPYALVFKDPNYWEHGMTDLAINASPNSIDLVPNDSKLYQTKLVLWKLLENSATWTNLRFGLASTYLPTTNDTNFSDKDIHTGTNDRFDFNGMYKVEPFGNNVWTSKKFTTVPKNGKNIPWPNPVGDSGWPPDNDLTNRKQFVNGVLTQAITGNVRGYNALHAQYYPMWSHMTNEPIFSSITSKYAKGGIWYKDEISRMQWIYYALHRGSLLVPIRDYDDDWIKNNTTTKHVNRVRQWINGFADLYNGTTGKSPASATNAERNKQWHYYKDPEIGVAGIFTLPHAIYPDPRNAYAMTRSHYKLNGTNEVITSSFQANAGGALNLPLTSSQQNDGEKYSRSIWYSNVSANTDYYFECFPYSTEMEDSEQAIKNHFNAGSGEAAGSVLDFFSPPIEESSNLADVSYPIRSACETNWVIVITTGQELKPALEDDDGNPINSYTYTAAQAIKNLYDATDSKRVNTTGSNANDNPLKGDVVYAPYEQVSMLPRSADGTPIWNNIERVDLDEPIQTLVVGIVPKVPKTGETTSLTEAEINDVKEMHTNLAKMAMAGRGKNPDTINTYEDTLNSSKYKHKAFIAEDTDGLTDAIMNALTVINDSTVVQPGTGAMAQSEALDDLDGQSDIYSYQYKIMRSDQWEATMRRDVVSMDADGTVRLYPKWTIGDESDTKIVPAPPQKRSVRYWKEGWTNANLVELEGNSETFGSLSGLNGDILPSSGSDYGGVYPYDAYAKWLYGNDYSYANSEEYGRSRMFTDLGQGGVVIVNDPVVAAKDEPLPGYNAWANNLAQQPQSPVLYAHTNDGLLRMIDPTQSGNGQEIMAIIPPPMLIPMRLAALVTNPEDDGVKRRWLPITEPVGGYRSYPAFTLDGSLQKRNFNFEQKSDGSGWGQYLLGALGRGGSGLYMLDVSDHDKPAMMWYRESIGSDKLVSSKKPQDTSPAVTHVYDKAEMEGSNDDTNDDTVKKETGYLKLGFNSPRPVMGVAPLNSILENDPDKQNFIALAGGTLPDSPLNPEANPGVLANNGGYGATLLIIEPKDGTILKAFDGSSVLQGWRLSETAQGNAPIMGMMVSEPTLFRSASSNPYLAGGIIAADNRGNIFRVDIEKPVTHELSDPSEWPIRTVATLQTNAEMGTSPNSYAIPHGVVVSLQGNNMWIAGGTADIRGKKGSGDNEDGVLRNERQMIFSFSNTGQVGPYTRDNFLKLEQDDPDDTFTTGENGKSGWYFELKDGGQNFFREYVSTKPILVNGTLFVATFIQKDKVQTPDSSVCEPDRPLAGDSRLYAVDIRTGKPTIWAGTGNNKNMLVKYVTFEDIKIASLTDLAKGGKGKLMIRFDFLAPGAKAKLELLRQQQPVLRKVAGSEETNTLDEPPEGTGGNIPPETTVINYWLMK
ncbi:MAG: hypothetical protein LBS45_09580 [Synergistaceae bacterium]|nr:hypothetical protein [Synergistaceae bacterium]